MKKKGPNKEARARIVEAPVPPIRGANIPGKTAADQNDEIDSLFRFLSRLRADIQGEAVVPSSLAVALLDLAIRLNSELDAIHLSTAVRQYRRPVGRPKKHRLIVNQVEKKKGGRPSAGLADVADILLKNLPQAIESERFSTWRLERGKRKSEGAALEYLSEHAFAELGEGRFKAARHLKTLKNKIGKLRKPSQNLG